MEFVVAVSKKCYGDPFFALHRMPDTWMYKDQVPHQIVKIVRNPIPFYAELKFG